MKSGGTYGCQTSWCALTGRDEQARGGEGLWLLEGTMAGRGGGAPKVSPP